MSRAYQVELRVGGGERRGVRCGSVRKLVGPKMLFSS